MDVKKQLDEIRSHFDVQFYLHRTTTASTPSCSNPPRKNTGAISPIEWQEKVWEEYIIGHSQERDDLLFFVRSEGNEEETVEVLRKNSKLLPGPSDVTVRWDQSFYLNLILHEFEYHVTCSAITFKPGTDSVDDTMIKISQQVYPSPNRRRMDKKGDCGLVYPNVMFCVDNFEEVFSSLHLGAPHQKVAVQLLASNKSCSINQVVFLVAVDYVKLVEACDKRQEQSSFSTKLSQLSLLPKPKRRRVYTSDHAYQFVQMRGPSGNGYAEMAVNQLAGSSPTQTDSPSPAPGGDHMMLTPPTSPGAGGEGVGSRQICSPELRRVLGLDDPKNDGMSASENRSNQLDKGVSTDSVGQVLDPTLADGGSCHGDSGAASENAEHKLIESPTSNNTRRKLKKFSKSAISPVSKLVRRKSSSSSHTPSPSHTLISVYLTYVQLPWYSLVEDILNSKREQVF